MVGQPIELGAADLTGVVFTFTDHPAKLSGIVRDADGKPDADAAIYLFSTDRRTWTNASPMSGAAREVRPSRNGSYQFQLTPGEYFITAVDVTANEDWRSTDALETLASTAKTVKIAIGQTVTLDLVVPKGK